MTKYFTPILVSIILFLNILVAHLSNNIFMVGVGAGLLISYIIFLIIFGAKND